MIYFDYIITMIAFQQIIEKINISNVYINNIDWTSLSKYWYYTIRYIITITRRKRNEKENYQQNLNITGRI